MHTRTISPTTTRHISSSSSASPSSSSTSMRQRQGVSSSSPRRLRLRQIALLIAFSLAVVGLILFLHSHSFSLSFFAASNPPPAPPDPEIQSQVEKQRHVIVNNVDLDDHNLHAQDRRHRHHLTRGEGILTVPPLIRRAKATNDSKSDNNHNVRQRAEWIRNKQLIQQQRGDDKDDDSLSKQRRNRKRQQLFYPPRRSPVDTKMLNCDAADVLRDNHNSFIRKMMMMQNNNNNGVGGDPFHVSPCLRLMMFSTLKPCIDEETIWTQFAAVASWASTMLYPSPVIVLYDTSLRTVPRDTSKFHGHDKDLDDLDNDVEVVHRNLAERRFVAEFAKDVLGLDLDEEANGNNKHPDNDDGTPPNEAARRSCGWLIAKMLQKFFPEPLRNVTKRSRKNPQQIMTSVRVVPRVAVVAPPERLVGSLHNTLLLGPALRHLATVIAPTLRPADNGLFDVVGFANSDIIFGPRLGPILSGCKRTMRRFMLVGQRRSLSVDDTMELFKTGFFEQLRQSRASELANEANNKYNNVNARRDEDEDELESSVRFPGSVFFDKFFPSDMNSNNNNNVGGNSAAGAGDVDGDNAELAAAVNNNPNKLSLLHLLATHIKGGGAAGDRIDAEDYFFWTAGFLDRPYFPFAVPPFHIGRPAFDNWLVSNSIHSLQPVADITASGLVAVHVEHSTKKQRKYWSGGEQNSDTKENYHLGETHGGWQHGLLEFAPLEVRWGSRFHQWRQENQQQYHHYYAHENLPMLPDAAQKAKNKAARFHEGGDVRIGMRASWKGLDGSGRRELESREAYWNAIQQYF